MSNQKIWVLEVNDKFQSTINLYEDEGEAFEDAVEQAIEYMEFVNHSNYSYWKLYYNEIKILKESGKLFEALDKYNDWADNLTDDDFSHIWVYSKTLIPRKYQEAVVRTSTETCIQLELFNLEITSSNEVTKKIVFCRGCNTELNFNETPCWKCGSEN